MSRPFLPSRWLRVAIALSIGATVQLSAQSMNDNPLLSESTLPFNYPHFDLLKVEHYAPAFDAGMAQQKQEIDTIASNPAAPTFENTIVALERSGRTLGRVSRVFFNLSGTVTNPEMQKIEKLMAPKLAAHGDSIRLNSALFERIQSLYQRRAELALDPESDRLLERYYKDFVRAGAQLNEADKTYLRALNAELATLHTTFAQNVLKETNASAVLVETRAELDGLSDNAIAAAASAAKAAGHEGKYLIRLLNTTGQPALASLKNRALRQRLFEASVTRNSRGGEFDNREVIAKIAKVRAERAALLGYAHHAALQIEEQTAGSVENVQRLMAQLAPPAVANARKEAADLQAVIDAEGGGFQLQPWDWDYYSEKVRAARYAFDAAQVRPYFEMNRVLEDGVFYAATQLFGITFHERTDLPKYHEDTRIFEVRNEDGSPVALFIVDWYARPSKRGGAWANAYVSQSGLLGTMPVIANHLNVPKPPAGEPTLLTNDEVVTAFHEFGHALHGMFSQVQYPRFAGTAVARDFVEFPSQVNEMWATWPAVLSHFAKHYQTGEPLPAALLEKIQAAAKFNEGYRTTEYLAATLLDLTWHQLKADDVPAADQVLAFEADALKRAGVDFAPVLPRYRSPYFNHIFASNGYAAGYYSYIWAEVLDADGSAWFEEQGGLNRSAGEHYRRTVLSRGGSKDAMEMYREFSQRDPEVKHLLKRRGLDGATAQ
ncbi:MAG: M3 family metallopeptidase [Candidatus Didemnitutus sp.]|nr:M3 family metallopeptidase [Candidatus Didemnitutus sp.]